jgi:glycosyltransferase involved in cell wall biosynthesis
MHIAHFTNTYLPVVNGVVRSVSAFRQALTDLGHNVFVFAQQQNDYEDQEAFIFRYPSLNLPLSGEIPAVLPLSPFVDRLMPALKLDVIHTHHPVLLGQAAANQAQELDLPLVFTFHTQYREYTHYVPFPQDVVQDFLKDTVQDWLQDFMRRCHHIVVPSKSMLDILVADYGLVGPYTIIPTGIDLAPYQSADGEAVRREHAWGSDRIMISIGRLAKEKNWELLLRAMALALRDYPDLRLVLLGDGPQRDELEELATQLGIAERVDFIGKVPFEEVPAYLKAADFFGFASTTETQGLVTMEALAAHLPVIAVKASGTRDIVQNGKQGLLVDEDPQALANGIRQLLADTAKFQKYQQAAQIRAKEFEMKALASQLVDVYQQAVQAKKQDQFVKVA